MAQRSIEDFKAVLQGGGVRPTMFEVELTFPDTVVSDPNLSTNEGIFLIKAAQLPASNVGLIEVPFRGRKLKVSGDRVFEDWAVTVTNDVSFGLRKAFEEWSERIQNRDGQQLRAYRFEGIWPQTVDAIDLDFDSTDQVEEYGVTFAVQYWSAIDSGDPVTSAVARDPSANLNQISS